MKLETTLNIALTEFFRPIVAQCVQEAIQQINATSATTTDADPNGDFRWLKSVFPGFPDNTLRQWDAAGKIPGSSKFGKRRIYHKQTVLDWQRSQFRQPSNTVLVEQQAEEQFNQQLRKRGGVRS